MKLERGFIRSKVGRRIFLLFFLCSLLPITVLTAISYYQVSHRLKVEGGLRRFQECRSFSNLMGQRIESLGLDLADLSSRISEAGPGTSLSWSDERSEYLNARFEAISIIRAAGAVQHLLNEVVLPDLPDDYIVHLRKDLPLIFTDWQGDGSVDLLLARLLNPAEPGLDLIIGRLQTDHLWYVNEDVLYAEYQLTMLDENGAVLHTQFPTEPAFTPANIDSIYAKRSGQMDVQHAGEAYLGTYYTIPLNARVRTTSWPFVLTEIRSLAMDPMSDFLKYFLLVVLSSIWVVLLLSIGQIRRNLVPLRKLQEGTKRIAERDFASRVDLDSDDEFEELGDSFNLMATQLGQQFNALSTTAELDRAVLSLLNEERIIETVLKRTCDVLQCDGLTITVFESYDDQLPKSYSTFRGVEIRETQFLQSLSGEDMDLLEGISELEAVQVEAEPSPYLQPLVRKDLRSVLVLPIRLQKKLVGVVAMGYVDSELMTDEEKRQARQLVDRFTVAFSNARLVMNLDQMSWGTLLALARAIDASSPWTAGHSERVTALALSIGRYVGMSESELETLHRGGLLHDLGKIGVPADILDKHGRLTDDEMKVMMGHTQIGARILQPIPVFPDVIPIVLQHHEHVDGSGYPDGISGDEISLGARVLAVADVYDALTSARPYRKAMEQEDVVKIIEESSGSQFDPMVVKAFLEFIRSGEGIPTPEYTYTSRSGRLEPGT